MRRHPDVFVLQGHRGEASEDWALFLAAPAGVLSAWSAARQHGMVWRERRQAPACVRVDTDQHLKVDGVVVLRWALRDVDVVDGPMPVTTRARTVVDCLRLVPRVLRERMLDTALLQEWLSIDELDELVSSMHGQRRVAELRALLDGVSSGARSRAERVSQQVLRRTGLPGWQWNYPVALLDGTTAVLDAALADFKIAVEIDGRAFHVDAKAFQHDRTRQNGLVALGWIVLRFTWWDLTHRPDYVVDAVLRAVSARAA